MTDFNKLYSGLSRVAWGYFFTCIDINFGTVSILPSFVGYLLFLSAISYLKDEERELTLLRTLGVILSFWYIAQWIASWGSSSLDGVWQFADVLISMVRLYFYFQLLTNLASIAAKYQPEGYTLDSRLLRYRTIQTVLLTAIIVITNFHSWLLEIWSVVSIVMMIVHLIVGICLMIALFKLRNCLPTSAEPQ